MITDELRAPGTSEPRHGDYERASREVADEYRRARLRHDPMHSGHEGWAVIREELDELWELVRADQSHTMAAYIEAKQIAAMAVAFMVEVAEQPLDA